MSNRILEMDALRGFAVLGILLYNINEFGLPANINSYPTLFANGYAANIFTWFFNTLFINDVMRGIFSMLFGASALILLSDEKLARQGIRAVDHYYRRNLILIAFGMLHAYILLWPYDVLFVYGLVGLLLFPLRKLPIGVILGAGIMAQVLLDVSLETWGADGLPDNQEPFETPSEEYTEDQMRAELMSGVNAETQFYHKNYFTILLVQIPIVITEQTFNLFNTHLFDMGGMMLIGMALYRMGILNGSRSARFYLLLALACYLVGLSSRGLYAYSFLTEQRTGIGVWLFDGADYAFSRVFVSVGHACVLMLIIKADVLKKLSTPLIIVGRMALTNYLLQTVISIFLFYGFGLGLYATFERYELLYVCAAIWLALVIFSMAWLHYFNQGPLEWLMRTIIRWQLQPFFRKRPNKSAPSSASTLAETSAL